MSRRDWAPVAPTWERDPDAKELWRRVAVMPALALNLAEQELTGPAAGRATCVLGVGDGMAPLALAALGAAVTVADPSQSMLDMLLVRARIVGVELNLIQSDLTDLAAVRPGTFQLAYAAQATHQLDDIVRFYSETFRILGPTCRLVINEYHPIRRIWKQEPGQPRVQHSYFDRRRTRDEEDLVPDPNSPFNTISRYEFNWTISDHCHALLSVGFRIAAIEEVGDVRQKWEIPNMKGLPEQLVIAADRPE